MAEFIDFPSKLRSTRADGKLVDASAIDGVLASASLISQEFSGNTEATTSQRRLGTIVIENSANTGYAFIVGNGTEFQLGNALRGLRSGTAVTVGGVSFYSNSSGHLLYTQAQATAKAVKVWKIGDILAIRAAVAQVSVALPGIAAGDVGSALRIGSNERPFWEPVLELVLDAIKANRGAADRGKLIALGASDEDTFQLVDGVTQGVLNLAVGGIFKRWSGGTLTTGQAHTLSVDVDAELGTFDDAVDGSRLVIFVSARIAAGDEATLKIESDASGSFETLETVALSTSRRTGRLFAAVPTDVSGGYPEQVVRAVLTGSATDNTVVEGMRIDVGMSRQEPVSDDERARINALALSTDALSRELDDLTEHALDTAAWVDTVESDHVHVGHEADPGGSAAPSHGHPTLTINQNAVNQALTLWVPRGVRPEGYRLQRVRGGTTTTWPQAGQYWRGYTTGGRLAEDTFHLDAYFLASESSDAEITVGLNTNDLLKGQKNPIVTVLNGEKLKNGSVDIDALDDVVVTSEAGSGQTAVTTIWRGTKAQYDAITSKSNSTLYLYPKPSS